MSAFELLLMLLIKAISPMSIEIPITLSLKSGYFINICLGTPKQCFNLAITTEESGITLYEGCPYTSQLSSTYRLIDTSSQSPHSDKLTLTDGIIFSDVHFNRLRTSKRHIDGNFGVGLVRNTEDLHHTLNRLLKNAHKRVFYINAPKFLFGFGDFPKQYYTQSKQVLRKTCKLKLDRHIKDNGYYCTLNSIFFTTTESEIVFHPINKDVSISFSTKSIQVPIDFYRIITQKYLKNALRQLQCWENDNDEEYMYVICKQDFNEFSLGYLTAIIGNWSFRITPQDLFFKHNSSKLFLLKTRIGRSDWVFGNSFIRNYITVVDQEAAELSFIRPSVYE